MKITLRNETIAVNVHARVTGRILSAEHSDAIGCIEDAIVVEVPKQGIESD